MGSGPEKPPVESFTAVSDGEQSGWAVRGESTVEKRVRPHPAQEASKSAMRLKQAQAGVSRNSGARGGRNGHDSQLRTRRLHLAHKLCARLLCNQDRLGRGDAARAGEAVIERDPCDRRWLSLLHPLQLEHCAAGPRLWLDRFDACSGGGDEVVEAHRELHLAHRSRAQKYGGPA
eukprot:scaffold298903_cov32-Tisochrysis_lutea.AAC.6